MTCIECQRRQHRVDVDKGDVYRAARWATRTDGAARAVEAIAKHKAQLQVSQDNLARHLADEH